MKIRILDNGKVNHNGHILETYEIYDLPEEHATKLVKSGAAKLEDQKKNALPEPETVQPVTPRFNAKDQGYVAAATPQRPLKEDEIDNTPVIEKQPVKEEKIIEKVEVTDGNKKLTPEEVKALENKPGAAPSKPSVAEAQKAETVK